MSLICILLAFPAHAQLVNGRMKAEHRQIRSVLILPPVISLHRSGLKSNDGLPDEADRVAATVSAAIAEELKIRGVALLPNPGTGTDEDKYAVADLQRKYDTVSVQLLRKPHGLEKGRYSLGDGVSAWRPAAQADALLFVRGSGTLLTTDKKAFNAVILRPANSTFYAHVAFVDARTGELLALSKFHFWRDVTAKSEESIRPAIRDVFVDLPLPLRKAPSTK
jgi:hypothetical protein